VSDKKKRMRRLAAGVGVGAGVCAALFTLALMSLGGLTGGMHASGPAWLKGVLDGLGQRGYDWITVDVTDKIATVSGQAPDVDSRQYGFEAAEIALKRADEAGEIGIVVDATHLEGGAPSFGAALQALGEKPAAAACQDAFRGTLTGRTITFAPASADLTIDNKRLLDAISAVAVRCRAYHMEIGGHTDASGAADANDLLSAQRAGTVEAYLINKGVPAEILTAKGYGARMPLDPARNPEADARNRRIEFTVEAH